MMPSAAMATPPAREPWDHGSARDAIDYALDVHEAEPANQLEFLRAWRDGEASEEWPDYYEWLDARRAEAAGKPPAAAIGRTELGGGGND